VQVTPIREFGTDLLYSVDIDEIRRLSNREFRKRYGSRSFSWRGRSILVRNHDIIHADKG
jgi:epoxyqueuosine reductase QueG